MQLLQRANFNGTNGNQFFLDLYQDNSQSVEGNASAVRYYAYVGSSGSYSGGGASSPVYINGQQVGSFSNIAAHSNTLIGYLDVIYPHDAQGNAVATYSARADTSWSLGDAIIYDNSFPLPQIPRQDSIISPSSGTIGKQVTITTTNNSSTFTHTLRYRFGTLQGTIASGAGNSYTWTIPKDFYTQIPNAKSGVGGLWCDTYSGETLIGSTFISFTAYADEADAKPTVSFSYTTDIISQSITGYADGVIKGVTDINYTITGTAKYSSTISKYYLSKNSSLLQETNSEGTITDADSNTYYVAVKDSRGYTSNISTINFEHYVDYVPLNITSMSVNRETDLSSKVYLNLTGTYFNGSLGVTNNQLTIEVFYRVTGASSWGSAIDITNSATIQNNEFSINNYLVGSDFSNETSYDIRVVVKDKVITDDSVAFDKVVTESTPTFRIRKNDVWYKSIKLLEYADSQIKINVDLVHPVGSLYFSTDPTNPSQIFGGTWIAWGAGRVPVGVDTSQTEFNTVEKTGGEKTHKLIIDEMPRHRVPFAQNFGTPAQSDSDYNTDEYKTLAATKNAGYLNRTGQTAYVGGDQPHNNLQPYITCYIWKRTA